MNDIIGFLSTRNDAKIACRYLKHALEKLNVGVGWQDDLSDYHSRDHREAAKRFIRNSHFSVAFVTEKLFVPSGSDKRCHQKTELVAIHERMGAVEHGTDGGRDSYKFFAILCQNSEGAPKLHDLKAAVEYDPDLNWLGAHANILPVPASIPEQCKILDEIAGQIHNWLRRCGHLNERSNSADVAAFKKDNSKANGRAGSSSNDSDMSVAGRATDFDALETTYLRSFAQMWSRGRVNQMDTSAPAAPALDRGESPFSFDPSRFIELNAIGAQKSGDRGTAEKLTESIPISRLAMQSAARPLILQGEAGAGKTTTLAAVATAMAARMGNGFERLNSRFANGKWSEATQEHGKASPSYMPVLMSCSTAAAKFARGVPDVDLLLDAILAELRCDLANSGYVPDDFRERLCEQPYALLMDGLDEVDDSVKAVALLESAIDLWSQVQTSGGELKVIVTSRPLSRKVVDADKATLERLSWDQILSFLVAYVDAEELEDRQVIQDRIEQEATVLWRRGDESSDPLKTPLLLNAFCWLQIHRGGFEGNCARFCREVIDHVLSVRSFSGPSGEKINPEAIRRLLQRLAYDSTGSGMGDGVLSLADAEAVIDEWSKSVGVDKIAKPNNFMRQISGQTGLFYPMQTADEGVYFSFAKRELFREYLSGERLARGSLTRATIRNLKAQPSQLKKWEPAIAFAAGILVDDSNVRSALKLPEQLAASVDDTSNAEEARIWLMAALAALSEIVGRLSRDDEAQFWSLIERVVLEYRERELEWTPSARADVAERLTNFGRNSSSRKSHSIVQRLMNTFLEPRREWVPLNGHEGIAFADTHVTVSDFHRFFESETSLAELWPRASESQIASVLLRRKNARADDASAQVPISVFNQWVRQLERPGAPVVHVNWFEAVAYCLWLTSTMRQLGTLSDNELIRLPKADEWKAMARACGGDNRYPWEGRLSVSDPSQSRVNSRHAEVRRPSVPGVFQAYGPEGLYDFGSNVRCWIAPDDFDWDASGPCLLEEEMDVQIAGGSWADFEPGFFHSDARPVWDDPESRAIFRGFRIVRTGLQD